MKPFETICIDIGVSPLLGGTLISIAEGVIEFGAISVCLYSNYTTETYKQKVDPILRMALDIEGVVGASYFVRGDVKISYGVMLMHTHINNGRVIDSPARLIDIAPINSIRKSLKFKPEIYLSATRKMGIEEGADNLVIHANLNRRSYFLSKKKKNLRRLQFLKKKKIKLSN